MNAGKGGKEVEVVILVGWESTFAASIFDLVSIGPSLWVPPDNVSMLDLGCILRKGQVSCKNYMK